MTDGYDLLCFMKLKEAKPAAKDEVACACAKYLKEEGYKLPATHHPRCTE